MRERGNFTELLATKCEREFIRREALLYDRDRLFALVDQDAVATFKSGRFTRSAATREAVKDRVTWPGVDAHDAPNDRKRDRKSVV